MMNQEFIRKVFSEAWFTQVSDFIKGQIDSGKTNEQKFDDAVSFGVQLVEMLDDTVSFIPIVGVFARLMIDNPVADNLERELVESLVELIYRTLKLSAQ
jgi:hypothetical protein